MASAAERISTSTIDPDEIAHFTAMAAEWWDPRGKFAPLHRMNPTRIRYLREQTCRHFSRDGESATPLENLSLLDVGCGGGLIAEPMAQLGAQTTAIDAGLENIKTALLHAERTGVAIDYRCTSAEDLAETGAQFDIVLALEIVEHVADTTLFYRTLAKLVKPGGLLILSTLNRTAKSYAIAIVGAEYILRWLPRGTHHWQKFIKPSEMARALKGEGLVITDVTGLTLNPLTMEFTLNTKDLDVNYLLTATPNAS
jgi:2-polyprenyl-6-hydroxyphenyl methylase/3-demethylubiquinone-9 3-methyltransferase